MLWEPGLCSKILKLSFFLAKVWGTSRVIMQSYLTKNQEKHAGIEQDTMQKWWGGQNMFLYIYILYLTNVAVVKIFENICKKSP